MRRLAAALAALGLCACSYQVHRIGDDRYLTDHPAWQPGTTRPSDVVAALGPPDAVRWDSQQLTFVYRSQRRVVSGLALSFYLKIFSREQTRSEDGTLLLVFDARDRLLYFAASDQPGDDLATDLGI